MLVSRQGQHGAQDATPSSIAQQPLGWGLTFCPMVWPVCSPWPTAATGQHCLGRTH
jgi:hypothetical protein